MAFFKFRKGGDDQATAAPPESIEDMRRRARHRLVGAAVLVLVGVIGFPLLFDNQPRPIAVDIPIDIPDKNKVKPLAIPVAPPATPETSAPAVIAAPTAAPAAVPAAALVPAERKQALATGKVGDKTSAPAAPAVSVAPKAAATPDKPADKPAAKPEEAAKPQGLLDGKTDSKADVKADSKPDDKKAATSDERFVVQVGAFADVTRARDARLKLEKAGLKTYTQVVETKDGRRIRVRVGPFASKAEVDKVAEKIRKLDLPAAILTL